jgi:hypothetical protein
MPFSNLNGDVLREIAFFLEPDASSGWRRHLKTDSAVRGGTVEYPAPHWRAERLAHDNTRNVRAFRNTCRTVRAAVRAPPCSMAVDERYMRAWCSAPDHLLETIK